MSLVAMLGKPSQANAVVKDKDLKRLLKTEGGQGSGNYGHAGRPGEVGGSAPSGYDTNAALNRLWSAKDFGAFSRDSSDALQRDIEDRAMRFGISQNSDDLNAELKDNNDTYDIVADYMGNGYKTVNEYFHQGYKVPKGASKEYIDGMTETLDRITANETKEDFVVYRSMRLRDELEEGDEFDDKAFVSTSLDKNSATRFGHGLLAQIYVPKGSRGVFLGNVDSGQRQEWEFLMPRQTKFRVIRIDQDLGQMELEIIQ